jgi:hypothetical protein
VKILLIARRVSALPWTTGGLALALARALNARGHELTLLCHDLDDTRGFAGVAATRAMREFRTSTSDWPLGFPAWARSASRRVEHDVSLSLCRSVGADVWMPVEPSAGAWLERRRASKGLPGTLKSLTRHHGVLRAALAEAVRRPPRAAGRAGEAGIHRIVMIGQTGAGEAARHLASSGLDQRVVAAPHFSLLPREGVDESARRRVAARALLGIGPERRVVLASAHADAGRTLAPLMQGVLDAHRRDARLCPLLLVLAGDSVAQHTRAARLGALGVVKVIGPTRTPLTALAACDAVALPTKAPRGAFEAGATGRMAADALRAGRPLLAASGAPGYELARAMLGDNARPGVIVDTPTPESFARGLRELFEPMVYADASRAAAAIGAGLEFSGFVDVLERELAAARA